MRKKEKFYIKNTEIFKFKIFKFIKNYKNIAFYNSNEYCKKENSIFLYSEYELIVGFGKIEEFINSSNNIFDCFKNFVDNTNDWLFGFWGYDLKNNIENLKSENKDNIKMPDIYFFRPKYVFALSKNCLEIQYLSKYTSADEIKKIFENILNINIEDKISERQKKIDIKKRVTLEEYLNKVNILKKHIKRGDIYEINFCTEFFAEEVTIDIFETYKLLNSHSPAPYSAFFRLDNKYLLSASPERFMKKKDKKIISQPIKGTIKRGNNEKEDNFLKNFLKNDVKEKAENVMIVDLVRNDLSRTAAKGSVNVEELCGIYGFRQVFQMVSTVSSILKTGLHFVDAIKYCFPPGSMTGAPKIKAMELIEKYETTKRGLYSGAVGYISPKKDFDFNVVIRSILYNKTKKYLSFSVGGAITDKSAPEKEYEECLLKAKAMLEVLKKL